MTIQSISPAEAKTLLAQGAALIDIRERDEYARENIPEAHLLSLSAIEHGDRLGPFEPYDTVIFYCQSGTRSSQNAQKLAEAVAPAKVLLLEGGVVLGYGVNAAFFLLSGFVGAGLLFAGISGFCGMARLLAAMPWNRR